MSSYFCVIITRTGCVITTSADNSFFDAYSRLVEFERELLVAHIIRQNGSAAKIVYSEGVTSAQGTMPE